MYVFKTTRTQEDEDVIEKAAMLIKSGSLVVFPTETVYGIGANALDSNATKKIFIAKGRPSDNPLIVHVSTLEMLYTLTKKISSVESKLISEFWPGPLTIIFEKSEIVSLSVTGGADTVAVRMPSNVIANKLISYAGLPIAAPSANRSGRPSGTQISDIVGELKDHVEMFIDDGVSNIGLESTVIKVENGIPIILRPGKVTPSDVISAVGIVEVDKRVFSATNDDEIVLSPGMKYRHYAPDCKCLLVESMDESSKVAKIKEFARKFHPKKVAIMCVNENISFYSGYENAVAFSMGAYLDYDIISKNLFILLREAEAHRPDIILIESVPKDGMGVALMNRLIRTCGYEVVHC
jgi:L-threonylcarbamoyladenylate synthase